MAHAVRALSAQVSQKHNLCDGDAPVEKVILAARYVTAVLSRQSKWNFQLVGYNGEGTGHIHFKVGKKEDVVRTIPSRCFKGYWRCLRTAVPASAELHKGVPQMLALDAQPPARGPAPQGGKVRKPAAKSAAQPPAQKGEAPKGRPAGGLPAGSAKPARSSATAKPSKKKKCDVETSFHQLEEGRPDCYG